MLCKVSGCAPTPGMCSQFASVMYNAIRCLRMWTDPGNILNHLNPTRNVESHISVDSDSETNPTDKWRRITGYSICGGGAFELCVYRSLRNHMKSCRDAELREVLKILSDSLLAVPLRLLQNSYAPAAKRMNVAQLLKCASPMINDALDPSLEGVPQECSHSIVGVDGKTGTNLLHAGCGVAQPLASKVLMLYQVLDVVIQVLRIDSVVSVTKLCPDCDSSDEEN